MRRCRCRCRCLSSADDDDDASLWLRCGCRRCRCCRLVALLTHSLPRRVVVVVVVDNKNGINKLSDCLARFSHSLSFSPHSLSLPPSLSLLGWRYNFVVPCCFHYYCSRCCCCCYNHVSVRSLKKRVPKARMDGGAWGLDPGAGGGS